MSEEAYPNDLKYFAEHDWARIDGAEAVLGITWFAQDALGEVVYAELPEAGASIAAGQPYAELESVKAVSNVFSPLSGVVLAVNDAVVDEPTLTNQDCYGKGWLIRIRLANAEEIDALMSAQEYRAFLDEA
ncbi:MAG: glycine cleavage system protein GcvH [Thermoleophilia bacterium]